MSDAERTVEEGGLNLVHRINQLRQLRAKMKKMEDEHNKTMEPFERAKKALEGALMQWLLDHKIKTANTAAGNITWVDNTTYPIEDQIAFRDFVIENKLWEELLDWKANKTGVTDYRNTHEGEIPPGLRENPHPHLRVSGPGKKKTPTKTKGFELDEVEEE